MLVQNLVRRQTNGAFASMKYVIVMIKMIAAAAAAPQEYRSNNRANCTLRRLRDSAV